MSNIWTRFNAFMLVLVFLALLSIIAMLARGAAGGPLNPPGPPESTGRPLDELYGPWSRVLDSTNGSAGPLPPAGCGSDRFKCTFFGPTIGAPPEGVLDMETGLVWERSPSATTAIWTIARENCRELEHGGRYGWRLPTLEELSTFTDGSGLPDGHPFTNISVLDEFWTATSASATQAYVAPIDEPDLFFAQPKTPTLIRHWCVRGGSGYNDLP